jgi:hypothetical protein
VSKAKGLGYIMKHYDARAHRGRIVRTEYGRGVIIGLDGSRLRIKLDSMIRHNNRWAGVVLCNPFDVTYLGTIHDTATTKGGEDE